MERLAPEPHFMADLLSELESKRNTLRDKAEKHMNERDVLNAEGKSLSEKRNGFNDEIRGLVAEAAEFRQLRSDLNEQVQEAKKVRDLLNKESAAINESINALKKKAFPDADEGPSLKKLKAEMKKLEFKQQTSVLTPDAERKLVELLQELGNQIDAKKNRFETNNTIRDAMKEGRSAKDEAEEQHDLVRRLADAAQKSHEKMITIYESVDELRTQVDGVQKKFRRVKHVADAAHNEFRECSRQVHDLDKMVYTMRQRRRSAKKARSKAEAKVEAESILDALMSGKKMSTDELMTLQRADELDR